MQRVVFGVRGLGKVDVLISLSKWFNAKVGVSKERYRSLEVLQLHEQFVVACDATERTRFEAVELVEMTRSGVDAWNRTTPTTAILLTGLFVGLGYRPFTGCRDIFVVPLSDHSPYEELQQFVANIRPRFVVPIVRTEPGCRDDPLAASLPDRTNVECFAEHLDPSPMSNYHIPLSVLQTMNHRPTNNATAGEATNSSCRKPVADIGSPSGQNLLSRRNSSSLDTLTSSSVMPDAAHVIKSDLKSNCVQWKRVDACSNTATSGIVRQRRETAVRPVKRCFMSRGRCSQLHSGCVKRRQHHSASLPSSFASRQKRFITNETLRRLPLSRRIATRPTLSEQLKPFKAADAFSLQKSKWTWERNPNKLEITSCNEACGTTDQSHCVLCIGGNGSSRSCAGSACKSVASVAAESAVNSCSGTTIDSDSCECTTKTNARLGCCVSPSVGNDARNLAYNVTVDGALNLTTTGTAVAPPPAFHRIRDSLENESHSVNDSLQRNHANISTVAERHLQRQCDVRTAAAASTEVSSLPPKKKWRQQFSWTQLQASSTPRT